MLHFLRFLKRSIIGKLFLIWLGVATLLGGLATAESPYYLGLNADLSGGSAESGESIRKGALIALDEVNRSGGIHGHPLQLLVANHRGIPARGKVNLMEFANNPEVLAVLGGLHTPVMMAEKIALFDAGVLQLPYLSPWAAGTQIVDNPWIFRLSVRDEDAGPFLLQQTVKRGIHSVGLLLENTAWGRSNYDSISESAGRHRVQITGTQWFSWRESGVRISRMIQELYQQGAKAILLVANAPEGAKVVIAMADRPKAIQLPIFSHGGITGGNFAELVGEKLSQVDLSFLQTYSFLKQPESRIQKRFLANATNLFPSSNQSKQIYFRSPIGIAHAYDLTHLIAIALRQTNTPTRASLRRELERIDQFQGLVRTYHHPFKPGQGRAHEALDADDYHLARFHYSPEYQQWIIRPQRME